MAENRDSVDKVLDVFRDFRGRRSGVLKALTTDYEGFYERCHPGKGEQCLVGLPNGTWKLKPPEMMLPCELPEPVLGINFARDGMPEQEWAEVVAAHSDSWLLAVAFYAAVRSGFTKREREMLFEKINDLPTVYEHVKSKDQSRATMQLKKPKSCSTDDMTSPHKYESGAATKDGHNDGSSSYGQSESSGTHVNSSSDDSGAQTDESGAAIEDGHNDGSNNYGQSTSSGTYVSSTDDDSGAAKDESGSAIENAHSEVSSSSEQSKSSGTHGNSSDDDFGDPMCFILF